MADPVRQVARSLAGARDAQLARVVALVDTMQARGQADALIAPLRARLRLLRPARRPHFGRLLFAPLDPVIVPATAWMRGTATVPRTALAPIEAVVRRHLGAEAAAVEAALREDGAAIAPIGARLWAAAADALRGGEDEMPPAWTEAGLAADAYPPLRRAIAAVMTAAASIDVWAGKAVDEPAPTVTELRRLLVAALGDGAEACALVSAVLLGSLPRACGAVLDAIAGIGEDNPASARVCAELAVDATIGRIETAAVVAIGSAPLQAAVQEIQRAALLLAGAGRGAGPRRRERLDAARRAVDGECRRRFANALADDLVGPMGALSAEPTCIPDLEAVARDLRRFEREARQLGGAGAYDDALRRAAELVSGLPGAVPLTTGDRVRLAEILAGSDQALRLFALG